MRILLNVYADMHAAYLRRGELKKANGFNSLQKKKNLLS